MWFDCNYRGGGISNSQSITKEEEGKYALDAVQNNPSIPGSLRHGLESVSEKVDAHIVNAWNNFMQTNQPGYINLARIKILSSYANYPLRFIVNGRGFAKSANLIVLFHSADNADPGIHVHSIDNVVLADYTYKFYIAKTASGTWDIYVGHVPYTSVAIIGAEIFQAASHRYFEVTYPNVLVDSLPEGSLEFTAE